VTLRVSRDGKPFEIKATLGQLPEAAIPRQHVPIPAPNSGPEDPQFDPFDRR
jgi:hypothetical protein